LHCLLSIIEVPKKCLIAIPSCANVSVKWSIGIDLAASCRSGRQGDLGKMFQRIGGNALRCAGRRPIVRRRLYDRKFSAYTTNASTVAPSSASPLGTITVELDRVAPRFEVSASKVTILDSPASFYTTLKVSRNGAINEDHCLVLTDWNTG
jgi:CDP-diacylglycerol--glycerol-3-phosphate 3-phosphatidyltransferase